MFFCIWSKNICDPDVCIIKKTDTINDNVTDGPYRAFWAL